MAVTDIKPEVKQELRKGLHPFSSLRNTDYRYLWIGNFFIMAGFWIQMVTVGWLVWELSASATMVGITGGLWSLPFIVMGPLGGVLADRLDRRRLLMTTQTVMAVIALLFAADVALHWVRVWHAMVFSFLMGSGFTLNQPVRQSLVANTVPRNELGNAIALNAMAMNATRVVGPAVGGVLIVAFGATWNFLLQAALYLCMVAIIIPMKVPYRDTASASDASPLRNLQEGIQYVWGNKTLFGLMILSFIPALFVMPNFQIMPAFTDHVLHAKANVFGYLMAVSGFGGLLGSFTMASFGGNIRSGWLGIIALSFATFFVILFSQSSQLWTAFVLLPMIGFSMMIFRVNNTTLVQTLAPDELRGRVMSIYQLDQALAPLGSFVLGVCADVFSITTAMAGSGILGLLVMCTVMASVKQMRDLWRVRV
jgi:MFS family permease